MSFSRSHGIGINQSTLNSFIDQHNHFTLVHNSDIERFSAEYRLNGLSTINIEDVVPEMEILSAPGYRIHSARYRGRVAVVKVFHGPNSKKALTSTVALNRRLMHPNFLHMIGSSSPSAGVDFIVFDADCDQPVESVLASSLIADLMLSVSLGLKMIGSLSSGLQYLIDCDVPVNMIGIDNFDIIFGKNEKISISINPSGLENRSTSFARPMRMSNSEDGWNVLNGLCQKTFSTINRILYREQLDRDNSGSLPANQSSPFLSPVQPSQVTDSASLNESSENPTAETPRREYVWLSTARGSSSLKDIASQFREFLNQSTSRRFPARLLRRLKVRNLPQTHHRCKGYRREEITLTTDIARSAIFSHATPTPREIYTICGELVVGADFFNCECGKEDDYIRPNIKCSICSIWQHYACVTYRIPPGQQNFVCLNCSVGYLDHSYIFTTADFEEPMQVDLLPEVGDIASIMAGNENMSPGHVDEPVQAILEHVHQSEKEERGEFDAVNSMGITSFLSQDLNFPELRRHKSVRTTRHHHQMAASEDIRVLSEGSSTVRTPYPSPYGLHWRYKGMDVSGAVNGLGGAIQAEEIQGGAGIGGSNVIMAMEPMVTADASRWRKQDASFVCPIPGCGSTFTRSFNLKGHIQSHNEEKPFVCPWPGCAKGFTRQHDCMRHELLHTNYRLFECAACRKQFARMDALNRHLRSEGGAECQRALEGGGVGGSGSGGDASGDSGADMGADGGGTGG